MVNTFTPAPIGCGNPYPTVDTVTTVWYKASSGSNPSAV